MNYLKLGYLIMPLMGIIFIVLPKFLPDNFFINDDMFIITNRTQYRKIREKQWFIMGVYALLFAILIPTKIIFPPITQLLLFSLPFVVIFGPEKELNKIRIKK